MEVTIVNINHNKECIAPTESVKAKLKVWYRCLQMDNKTCGATVYILPGNKCKFVHLAAIFKNFTTKELSLLKEKLGIAAKDWYIKQIKT